MARICTTIWIMAFGIGYELHAIFMFRFTWPSAASALTATYFHLAGICFSWGYTSLLNPMYLTRRIAIRDVAIYVIGLISYWTVALLFRQAPLLTMLSFCIFFGYAFYVTYVFYRTYNRVTLRMMKMSMGSWPYPLLLTAGVGMFGYMVYSIEKYGGVIDAATKATLNVALDKERENKKKQ